MPRGSKGMHSYLCEISFTKDKEFMPPPHAWTKVPPSKTDGNSANSLFMRPQKRVIKVTTWHCVMSYERLSITFWSRILHVFLLDAYVQRARHHMGLLALCVVLRCHRKQKGHTQRQATGCIPALEQRKDVILRSD